MKNRLLFPSALVWAVVPFAAAQAQEVGRVISSTAMISQVSVPRQVCAHELVQVQNAVPATKSGAGALMGSIAGGAMGNAVGQGSGRAAATILGILGGAILGDRIEGGSPAQVTTSQQTVNRCSTQNFMENRTTGYQVVYEYAGKQYSVQLPQDPGPTIQLQVTPAAAVQQPAQNTQPQFQPQSQAQLGQESQPQTFIAQAPAAVVYASPQVVYVNPPVTYYPQPAFNTSFVIRAGGGGHWHGNPGYYGPGPYGHWR